MRFLWRGGVMVTALAISLGLCLAVSGCAGFFVCQKASCSTSTNGGGSGASTGSTTNDFAFVGFTTVSGSTTTATINGYSIGSGALTSTGSLSLSFVPLEMVVAPSNNFLYVASTPGAATPGIYGFAISSAGALSPMSGNPQVSGVTLGSMAISPDGGYLYTIDLTGTVISQYSVNTASGALTAQGGTGATSNTGCTLSLTTPAVRTCDVEVSPNGAFVSFSLGPNGTDVFQYASSTGINTSAVIPIQTGNGVADPSNYDFAAAWDKGSFLYLARTSQFTNFNLTTNTSATQATTPITGVAPRAIALTTSYGSAYTANPGAGTISGYSITTTGAMTALTGSPFTGPANVAALGFERSGAYAVAVGYDTSTGLQLLSVSSAGVLAKVASASTTATTTYPVLLALVH